MPVAIPADSIASAAGSHLSSTISIAVAHGASGVSAPAISASSVPFASNDAWVNGFATLIGAFVGAIVASWVAYALTVRVTKKKEREHALFEGHQVLYCLTQQLNTILLVWRDHFAKEIESPGRFMNVVATTPFDIDRYIVDAANTSILLDRKEGRALLYELSIAQDAYREALFILNERARVHRDELQPALDKAEMNGEDVTNEEMMDKLGRRLVLSMMGMTDGSYMMMHKSFVKLAAVKDKARAYLVRRFESDDFVKVDFPDTLGIFDEPKMHYLGNPPPRRRAAKFSFGTAYYQRSLWPEQSAVTYRVGVR